MRFILINFLLFFSLIGGAQNSFQGKAIYQSKTTIDLDNWGNGQLSEERKKQIKERMKSMLEKTYTLNFTASESIYKEEEKLEAPGQEEDFVLEVSAPPVQSTRILRKVRCLRPQNFLVRTFWSPNKSKNQNGKWAVKQNR